MVTTLHCDSNSNGSIASAVQAPAGDTSIQRWRQAASQNRSAGMATSAVRLRRKGGQFQGQQANGFDEEPLRHQSVAAAQPSDRTRTNGAALNGAQPLPDQRQPNGHSAADDETAGGLNFPARQGAHAASADSQPATASSGIQATDWLTENAPWVAYQALPNDGATWPSSVSSPNARCSIWANTVRLRPFAFDSLVHLSFYLVEDHTGDGNRDHGVSRTTLLAGSRVLLGHAKHPPDAVCLATRSWRGRQRRRMACRRRSGCACSWRATRWMCCRCGWRCTSSTTTASPGGYHITFRDQFKPQCTTDVCKQMLEAL